MCRQVDLNQLPSSEPEDFRRICLSCGRQPAEFIVTVVCADETPGGGFRVVGSVYVAYEQTLRAYPHRRVPMPWLFTFEGDLRDGVFG